MRLEFKEAAQRRLAESRTGGEPRLFRHQCGRTPNEFYNGRPIKTLTGQPFPAPITP